MSEEKQAKTSKLFKAFGSIPSESLMFFLLITWVLQPGNNLLLIGLAIGGLLLAKSATFPIKVIKFVKSGQGERVELTEARKYTINIDGVTFTKLSIIGKKTDITMPEAKFFRFNKKNITNFFQGESIIMNVDGENYTPVFKPQGTEKFISEADRHEQIQDMKKRKERIESKENTDKFLALIPYALIIATVACLIWVVTEIEGIIITDLPHTIRLAASDIIRELFTTIAESGQTLNIGSVNDTLNNMPII